MTITRSMSAMCFIYKVVFNWVRKLNLGKLGRARVGEGESERGGRQQGVWLLSSRPLSQ